MVLLTWILPMELGISRIPTRVEDLELLKRMGVGSIVCLATEREIVPFWRNVSFYRECVRRRKMNFLFCPTPPKMAPPVEEMIRVLKWMNSEIRSGRPVAVHCFAGVGRAGTLAAAYLIFSSGMPARSAMERVRRVRPGAIESDQQEESLRTLSATLMVMLAGEIPLDAVLRPLRTKKVGALERAFVSLERLLRGR